MTVAGIIAEYNPFHNGHQFHIEETRRMTGCTHVIAVMSGSFVQRGEPALADKHLRAEMALRHGADLVIELPCAYATASAERFAAGAVEILDRLGIIDILSFGSENTDMEQITQAAKLLCNEAPDFSKKLQEGLREGHTFALARANALPGEYAALLATPNALLGVEYCKALYKRRSLIRPVAVARRGSGHHEIGLCGHYASAGALRGLLRHNAGHMNRPFAPPFQPSAQTDFPADSGSGFITAARPPALPETELLGQLDGLMPPSAAQALYDQYRQGALVFADDFSQLLQYRILLQSGEALLACPDVSPDLLARIRRHQHQFSSFSQFADLLKTKNVTHSRVRRALLQILLGIHGYPPVRAVRVLGFCRESAPLLSAIHKYGDLHLLTSQNGDDYDISADILYDMMRSQKTGAPMMQEWSKPLQIIEPRKDL